MMHLEFAKPLQQFTDLAKQGRTRVLPKNKLFRWALSGSGHVNNCQREREQRIVKEKRRGKMYLLQKERTPYKKHVDFVYSEGANLLEPVSTA